LTAALEFDLGLAMASFIDADGFMGVQIDAIGEGKSGLQPYELHHPFGFVSRPSDPTVDANGNASGGCTVLFATEGSRGHAFLFADGRVIPNLVNIKPGESAMYAAPGQFIRANLDGSITFFTTDAGGAEGQSVTFSFAPDGWEWSAPWGRFRINATGFHYIDASGARLDLGAIGGLPDPLSAISSYFSVQAASASIKCGITSLGSGPSPEPAAKATTLLAYVSLLEQAVELLATAVASATGADPASLTALGVLIPNLKIAGVAAPTAVPSSVTVS